MQTFFCSFNLPNFLFRNIGANIPVIGNGQETLFSTEWDEANNTNQVTSFWRDGGHVVCNQNVHQSTGFLLPKRKSDCKTFANTEDFATCNMCIKY